MSRPLYRPNPDVVFTELEEQEAVLLHLKTRRYFSLNETGILIWKGVQAGEALVEIALRLEAAYDIDAETAATTVQAFVEELVHDRLVDLVAEHG